MIYNHPTTFNIACDVDGTSLYAAVFTERGKFIAKITNTFQSNYKSI